MCSRYAPLLTLVLLIRITAALATTEEISFAIVGAGSAGSVLAGKLCTALPNAKIVLFERAPPRSSDAEFLVRAPRNAWAAWSSELVSEVFPTKPNPGLNGRTSTAITGNTLGGSAAINGLQFTVPLRGTASSWGIRGLSESVAQNLFRRVLKRVGFKPQSPPFRQIYTSDYLTAAGKAGFCNTKGPFSGKDRDEIWENRVSADRRGRRVDSFTAYVVPVRSNTCKDNLVVMEDATVTRIILKRRCGKLRATGVEYVSTTDRGASGKKRMLVTHEVILSAGPYGSPKLLQLSGIGPRDVLEAVGISVKKKLPVGSKTQGRPSTSYLTIYTGVPIEPSNNKTLLDDPTSRAEFEAGMGGVYGASIGAINARVKGAGYVAVTSNLGPGQGLGDPLFAAGCLTNPESFGAVRVVDKDPFVAVEVDTNLLGEQADVDRTVKCLKRLDAIKGQMAAKFVLVDISPTGAGLNESFARSTAGFGLHFVGGCRVGEVVNRRLLVRGVAALRVVDASVFGEIPRSAGPLASTYVIAEFMAEQLARLYGALAR